MVAQRILLLDFDGTVCRGDEPVREYARRVATAVRPGDAQHLIGALERFLDGTDRGGIVAGAQDGYQAVSALAASLDVPPEHTEAAFLGARAALAAGEIDAEVPAGLLDLLGEVGPSARRVLVTNAPGASLGPVLDRLGLAAHLDEVIADAGKPSGLPGLIERLLDAAGAVGEPQRLLSIGDIWANDLRAARERGCMTAYVDRFDRRQGDADARAESIEDLYDVVRRWALITMSPSYDAEPGRPVYPPFPSR